MKWWWWTLKMELVRRLWWTAQTMRKRKRTRLGSSVATIGYGPSMEKEKRLVVGWCWMEGRVWPWTSAAISTVWNVAKRRGRPAAAFSTRFPPLLCRSISTLLDALCRSRALFRRTKFCQEAAWFVSNLLFLFFSPKFYCRIHHQITRWTQTDNDSVVSRASLDWDNYESERLRTEVDLLDMEHHRLTNAEDEGVEGMTTGLSSTTLLMVSHGSNDTTLQASRISNRSASSPYVLCFECSEDFSVNDERRGGDNLSYFAPRHTSSSPRPPRRTRRSPPTPPAQPNLMDPSPTSRDHLNPDGQQDGRSSKAVKPRRK